MRYWNFFKEVDQLQRELEGVFRGFDQVTPHRYSVRQPYPRINLREDEANLYLEALMPGVDPKAIEISVLDDSLVLSGERTAEDVGDGVVWHRREREHNRFHKEVALPAAVNVDKIKAESKQGLLRVTLPKQAAAKPKIITVKVN